MKPLRMSSISLLALDEAGGLGGAAGATGLPGAARAGREPLSATLPLCAPFFLLDEAFALEGEASSLATTGLL